jgi:hypothetical protein
LSWGSIVGPTLQHRGNDTTARGGQEASDPPHPCRERTDRARYGGRGTEAGYGLGRKKECRGSCEDQECLKPNDYLPETGVRGRGLLGSPYAGSRIAEVLWEQENPVATSWRIEVNPVCCGAQMDACSGRNRLGDSAARSAGGVGECQTHRYEIAVSLVRLVYTRVVRKS